MKHTSKLKEFLASTAITWVLFYILLGMIIIETFVDPEPYSRAIRGLAICILLLAFIVRDKR